MSKRPPTQLLSNYRVRRKRNRYHPEIKKAAAGINATSIFKIEYNETDCQEYTFVDAQDILTAPREGYTTWINIAGFNKKDIDVLGEYFKIHYLLTDDVLSIGQRAKIDDMGNQIFSLLPIIFRNKENNDLEIEQFSFIFSKNLLISFQETAQANDLFKPIKEKIQSRRILPKHLGSDYLAYSILDKIVDNYFTTLEPFSEQLDDIEEEVMKRPQKSILINLSLTRQELMVFKRNTMPVRELINGFLHSDNPLIADSNKKFFKDIFDHISLAIEYNENYRDMILNLQDLYMNQINAKMNEVMKILTVVTTILAPTTVISSFYGMNFNHIPFSEQHNGFIITIGIMFIISISMIFLFRKKGWF